MKFSIIVPVYNVEKYLCQCVESIECQKYKNYEIILVDDGSTDDSPNICDRLKRNNNVIKVIHKSNGGLSDARNVGANQATGEYIIYLDSDDYWNDSSFLGKVYEIVSSKNPDLVIFGYKKILDGKDISCYIPRSKSNTIEELVMAGEFNICAWDKVVKREVLTLNNIYFRRDVYSEDMEWCSLLYAHAKTVSVLSEAPHSYRQRSGSITKKISEKNIIDIKNNFEKCVQIKNDMSREKGIVFEYYLAKNISMFMIILSQLEKNIQIKYYPFVKQNIKFLKKKTRKREVLIYILAKVFGIPITERLISYAFGVKKFLLENQV